MNNKSKIPAFQLFLFSFSVFLCVLPLLFPGNLRETVMASTVTPSGHTTFSQSFCLTNHLMVSADITPLHNTHYYYVELSEPASLAMKFSHDSQGHFDFVFHSLDETIKYTTATDKSSYNWKIKNLPAGRYYLTVSCAFYTCTEEQYTLSCSLSAPAQETPTPAANPGTGNSVNHNSATYHPSSGSPDSDGSSSSPDVEVSSEISTDDGEKIPSSDNADKSPVIQGKNQDKNKNKKTDAKKNKNSTNKKILIHSLQLKNRKKSLYISSFLQLKPHIRPKTATNQSLRFCSSDNSIAHVSKKGCVRALKKGIVDITAKSVDGSHLYATYTLKIKERKFSSTDSSMDTASSSEPSLQKNNNGSTASTPPPQPEKKTGTSIHLSDTSVTLHVKNTARIKACVFPKNADDKKLDWKSLNPGIASVSHGKISAVSPGITTIIVSLKSNPSIRTSCTVTVK